MTSLFDCVCKPHIVRNAVKIALVVGTLLNLINQGEGFVATGAFSWAHFVLNYCVPYCVASYSAAANEMARAGDGRKVR